MCSTLLGLKYPVRVNRKEFEIDDKGIYQVYDDVTGMSFSLMTGLLVKLLFRCRQKAYI